MAMTRVQRSLLFAVLLAGGGGAAALYTLKTKVKTPDERFKEEREAQRYFHFGRIHVETGRLTTKTATFTFTRVPHYGWQITDPVVWPAEDKAIDAILDRTAGIGADTVVTEDATPEDLARTGLDTPAATIRVTLKEGAEHTLHVGPKNKMVDKFPVTDAAKKRIGLSSAQFMWALDRDLFEYRDKRLFPFDPKAVTALEVREGDDVHLVLAKDADRWSVGGEGIEDSIRGDASSIAFLLTALTKRGKVERFVDDAVGPEDLAKYGLDRPAHTVTMRTKDGASRTAHFAHVEETSADEATTMVFVEGGTTVAALRTGVAQALEAPAVHYRDRTLSRFSPSAVRKLRIEMAGEPTAELEKVGDRWRMLAPTPGPAKTWRADAVARPFAQLRVASWKTEASSRQQRLEWLLEPWSRRIVVYGAGDEVLADVRIGNLADDEHMFVMLAGSPRVGLVEAKRFKALPNKVEDLLGD